MEGSANIRSICPDAKLMERAVIVFTIALLLLSLSPIPVCAYVWFQKGESPASPTEFMCAEHDANEVKLGLLSSGQVGLDIMSGGWGGTWPKETENNYILCAGFWIGGIADIDGSGTVDTFAVQS